MHHESKEDPTVGIMLTYYSAGDDHYYHCLILYFYLNFLPVMHTLNVYMQNVSLFLVFFLQVIVPILIHYIYDYLICVIENSNEIF